MVLVVQRCLWYGRNIKILQNITKYYEYFRKYYEYFMHNSVQRQAFQVLQRTKMILVVQNSKILYNLYIFIIFKIFLSEIKYISCNLLSPFVVFFIPVCLQMSSLGQYSASASSVMQFSYGRAGLFQIDLFFQPNVLIIYLLLKCE